MDDHEDLLKKQIQGVLGENDNQWIMGRTSDNFRTRGSRRGSFNAKIAIGLLAIQASLLLILSAKSNSSGAYGSESWRSIYPVSIPFLIWIFAASIKGSAAYHHHIEKLFPISISSFVIGSILIVYFYFGRDGSFFLPSFYCFIISATTNLLSISEYLDEVVFDWSGVLEILIDGSKETNKDGVRVVALAPIISEKESSEEDENGRLSLSFVGTNRINRNEIVVPNERLEEKKTHMVGFLVKRHTTGEWNPATVDVLYDHSRAEGYDGFSIGASTKIEENSLFYLLLISISNLENKWSFCKPLSLFSGEGSPPVMFDGLTDQQYINHRWTKEELSHTALMIMRSISRTGPKIMENTEPDLERRLFDVNQDGLVDWKDVYAALDVNQDGKIDIRDVTALPGFVHRMVDVNQDGVFDLADVSDFIARILGRRTSKDLAFDQSRRYLAEMAIRESVDGCITINMHLMLGFLSCLSSLEVLERHQLSLIAWREMCNVYPIMARTIVDEVKKDPENLGDNALERNPKNIPRGIIFRLLKGIREAANDPTEQFTTSYDDVLNMSRSLQFNSEASSFLTRCQEDVAGLMVDKVDQEPLDISPSQLLEKRRGVVLGSTIIMNSLRDYSKYFFKSDEVTIDG